MNIWSEYFFVSRRTSTGSNLAIYVPKHDDDDVEDILLEYIATGQAEAVRELAKDPSKMLHLLNNWDAVKKSAQTFLANHNAAEEHGRNCLLK